MLRLLDPWNLPVLTGYVPGKGFRTPRRAEEGDKPWGGARRISIAGPSVPVGFDRAEVNGSLRPLAGVVPSTEGPEQCASLSTQPAQIPLIYLKHTPQYSVNLIKYTVIPDLDSP